MARVAFRTLFGTAYPEAASADLDLNSAIIWCNSYESYCSFVDFMPFFREILLQNASFQINFREKVELLNYFEFNSVMESGQNEEHIHLFEGSFGYQNGPFKIFSAMAHG